MQWSSGSTVYRSRGGEYIATEDFQLSRTRWAINQLQVSRFAFGAGVKFHSAAEARNPLPRRGGVTLRHVEAPEALTIVGLPRPPHRSLLVP